MSPDDDTPATGSLERTGGKLVYRGPIASVRMDRFVYPDGSSSVRQIVVHPGSVAILAHDASSIQMVRQPRPAVGVPDLLELPAGKLDKEGETPLECAQRELAEEVGKSAGDWRFLSSFYTSPGFTNEECHLFMATELYEAPTLDDPDEPLEIVEWPLDRLDEAIEGCMDAASLVGLLMLKRLL